jgi:hypothetical protein
MTEAEWLTETKPWKLIPALVDHASPRKVRLLAVACLRRVWPLFHDERCHHAVETAERMADGLVPEDERRASQQAAETVISDMHANDPISTSKEFDFRIWAERGAVMSLDPDSSRALENAWGIAGQLWMFATPASVALAATEEKDFLVLIRDIVGNPFRPLAFDPTCRTGQGLALARAAYDERALPSGHLDTMRLASLADALEEAGCTDRDVLDHLRSAGPHVRGCWAVDLVLANE